MAAYYEKLTNLFWVSENYLFHAFAWYKYYSLCKEYNRGMSEEMKSTQASAVILAALCIPTSNSEKGKAGSKALGRDAIQSTVEDDIAKEKMARMATLLGFHTTEPSREAILAEIRSRNIMEDVPEYLRELFVILEEGTDPLDMVDRAQSLLQTLRTEAGVTSDVDDKPEVEEDTDDHLLAKYVQPMTDVLILKLISNLSAAYHTISLDHVKNLTSGLGVSFEQMEKTIVLSSRSRALSVRIDHRVGCIRFGNAALESDEMRGQLSTLAKRLTTACNIIAPSDDSAVATKRVAVYADTRDTLESEHIATLERRVVIEKRKEEAERLVQDRLRKEEATRKAEEKARKEEEDRRLVREQKMREREKLQKIQEEMDALEKKRYLTAMGRSVENMTAEQLKEVDTAALAKEHAEKANKKKEEAERKVREAAKQLDYLVRAVRIEELPLIKSTFDSRVTEDKQRYEEEVVESAKQAKEQWESDVTDKAALGACSVFDYSSQFESMIMSARKVVHEKSCQTEDQRAELEAEKGKLDRARKRKLDEAQKIEEERLAAEKAEADRKAEEERQRKEEEKRAREEEMEKKERERMEEQREREVREHNEQSRPSGPPSRGVGGGGSGSSYVPPSRRGAGGGGDGGGGGSRWGNAGGSSDRDRGGGYGGGRYEGSRDRDGGGSRGGGGGYESRDRDGGGSGGGGGGRYESRDSDRGPPTSTNSRWS